MVGLTSEQRRMLIDKLPDAANVALGALGFSQFLGDRPVSLPLVAAGLALWLVLGGSSVMLAKGMRQ